MSDEILDEMDFKKNVISMSDRDLAEFSAIEVYKIRIMYLKMYEELFGTEELPGLKTRIIAVEKLGADNRRLILAIWAMNALIIAALIGLFVQHLAN